MTSTSEIPSNQVAKPKAQIRDLLLGEKFKSQIVKALPRHMNPERFARIALTATYKNPKLLDCTQESLLNCLLELSAIGLEPDGRRAHLIPFKDNRTRTTVCTLLIDYKGIAELLRRNGDVAYIHCDVVGENDHFLYRFGTGGKLEHIPATGDRGPITCAYSFIRLKDGTEEYDVMAALDIERIRKRSRAAEDGPWVSDWNEMAKKTVFRRHSKTLPLSPEMRDVIEHDDEALTEQERFAAAKPANVAAMPTVRPDEPRRRKAREPERDEAEPSLALNVQEDNSEPDKLELNEKPAEEIRMTQVDEVKSLLAMNGYTEAELLAVLRQVRLVTDKHPANSVADLGAEVLYQVLEYTENTLGRLAQLRKDTQAAK
jgi:recombination protein RecT